MLHLNKLNKLALSGNGLSSIAPGTFMSLDRLNELRLSNNHLISAAVHFGNKNQLRSLDLSMNRITELRTGDFTELKHFEALAIRNGPLKSIELGALSSLVNLVALNLSYNELANLDFRAFSPSMPMLTTLKLDGNELTELSDDFEHLFPKLDELLISKNDFNCSYL